MAESHLPIRGLHAKVPGESALFAYGTLMCPDILSLVCRCEIAGQTAHLEGYQRLRVAGEHYPALVPAKPHSLPSTITGILYRPFPPQLWGLLDEFEGNMYERRPVQVMTSDGSSVEAMTYLCRPESTGLLTSEEWSFESFLRSGKPHFLSHYHGFTADR